MKETHTSYKLSKMLNEFLGESAPEPMGNTQWVNLKEETGTQGIDGEPHIYCTRPVKCSKYPYRPRAYRLEDLLSKPFAEAMFPKLGWLEARDVTTELFWAWEDGGLPAVEEALCKMMEAK